MGLFRKRKQQDTGAGQPPGADYSMVRDEGGEVVGLWIRDGGKANDQNMVIALLLKHGLAQLAAQPFRVVPNRYDRSGGSFVMFGGVSAPGEPFESEEDEDVRSEEEETAGGRGKGSRS